MNASLFRCPFYTKIEVEKDLNDQLTKLHRTRGRFLKIIQLNMASSK